MERQTSRRERKRQQIADLVAETAWGMFETQGFENVSMEAIALAADVAKGTLYNYFPVKEALLQHHFQNELQQNMPALLQDLKAIPTAMARMRHFFNFSAEWSEARRSYIPHYLHFRMNTKDNRQRSGMHRVLAYLIESGMKSGEFRHDLPLETSTHFLTFLYFAVLVRWLDTPGCELKEELNAMLELFLNGLRGTSTP